MRSILPDIRSAVWGAEEVKLSADGLHVNRFNSGEQVLYQRRSNTFFRKSRASAGIGLHFRTDSRRISISADIKPGSSRKYFSLDVLADGTYVGGLQNFDTDETTGKNRYFDLEGPLESISGEVALPVGEHEIEIVLPWSVETVLTDVRIDRDAGFEALLPEKKFLFYGDSITQGYDALYPSARYPVRICRQFRAAEYNKAIGGEIFFPELAAVTPELSPDAIFVAYGTNDWFKCAEAEFTANCGAFFENLCQNHPTCPIFALTPIWRGDGDTPRPMGLHTRAGEIIRELAGRYENVTVIDGSDFLPADPSLFADGFLHPNDRGFACFARRLLQELGQNAKLLQK